MDVGKSQSRVVGDDMVSYDDDWVCRLRGVVSAALRVAAAHQLADRVQGRAHAQRARREPQRGQECFEY